MSAKPVKSSAASADHALAVTLTGAAGNKAAAIQAAALATGDALRVLVQSGRNTLLDKAAAAKFPKSKRADMVRGAFVHALAEAAPWLIVSDKGVTDTRKHKRGTDEEAAAASAVAVMSFHAFMTRAQQSAADKAKAEAEAPAATQAGIVSARPLDAALQALAEAFTAQAAAIVAKAKEANPAAAASDAQVLRMTQAAEAEAAEALAVALERIPRAATILQAAAAAMAARAEAAHVQATKAAAEAAALAEAAAIEAAHVEAAAIVVEAPAAPKVTKAEGTKGKKAEAAPMLQAA